MSVENLALTPLAKSKRVSTLSRVRGAFKSPLRSSLSSSPSIESPSSVVVTPTSSRKRRHAFNFNSPLKIATPLKVPRKEYSSEDIKDLKNKIEHQEESISALHTEGIFEEDLAAYIDKLHKYNETKDAAQLVIGRLALQLQTTTKDLYPRFGLDFAD